MFLTNKEIKIVLLIKKGMPLSYGLEDLIRRNIFIKKSPEGDFNIRKKEIYNLNIPPKEMIVSPKKKSCEALSDALFVVRISGILI